MAIERKTRPQTDDASARCAPAALRQALELVADAVLFVDPPTLRVQDANRAAAALLGCALDQLRGTTLPELVPELAHEPVAADSWRQVTFQPRRGAAFAGQLQIARSCGEQHDLFVVVLRPDSPQPTVPAEPAADPLTSLPIRPVLEERLNKAVKRARAGNYHFALFFVDVDSFKRANDTLGHLAGDAILRTVAERLAAALRPTDLVARYGGDEFVALLDEVRAPEHARAIAERMRQRLQPPIALDTGEVTVTASIGIALSDTAPLSAAGVLHAADQAMYEAKRQGRAGRFVVAGG